MSTSGGSESWLSDLDRGIRWLERLDRRHDRASNVRSVAFGAALLTVALVLARVLGGPSVPQRR